MDLTNKQLSHYRVDREIGQGGMATIYHAIDLRDHNEVALKVLLPHLARDLIVLRRFQKEGENGQRLRHPNITRVLESGEADGYYFMTLQFASNGSLDRQLQRRKQRKTPMPVEETIALLRPVAAALDYAHGKGVLHRDIKPSNVLIDADEQVLLSDFGIARRLDPNATQLTMTNTTVGTPAYMSPEQAEGDQDIDARADIYSLGVMAYEMLTNELPFSAATPTKLLQKILEEPPAAPESFNPDLVPGVSFALRKVLAKSPEHRYDSASEFVNALERGLAWSPRPSDWAKLTPTSQPAAQRRYRVVEDPVPAKAVRRPLLGVVLGVLGLALITFAGYSFMKWQSSGADSVATPTLPAVAIADDTAATAELPATPTVAHEKQAPPTLVATEAPATATEPATNTPALVETPLPDLTATAATLQAAIETAVAATAEVRLLAFTQTAEAVEQTATAAATIKVTSTPVPTSTAVPAYSTTTAKCVSAPVVQIESIIMREFPWNTATGITRIPRGDSASIFESYESVFGLWFHVDYENKQGWVEKVECPPMGNIVNVPKADPSSVLRPSPTSSVVHATSTAVPVIAKTDQPQCVSAPGAQFTSIILRDRPWNSYNQITTIVRGQSAIILATYQNQLGAWFYIRYNNQAGWAKQDICQTTDDLASVPTANSSTVPGALPTAILPPPTKTPVPVNTPVVKPTATKALPTTIFFHGQLIGCKATSVGTFFEGMVYVNGQPADGYRIVFRSSKGSGPATDPVISGIGHDFTAKGALDWPAGYYKHVIQGSIQSPAKTWVVWIVDEKGKAISDELFWTADGPGSGCNFATVNFSAGGG